MLKCKMCGGTLQIDELKTVAKCEFCGSTQTITIPNNDKKNNLYNRANSFRMKNEFDKAMAIYNNIIAEFPNEAEAHWGVVLCRYGIEYVDDPRTKEKIPTCNRTQFKSIYDDNDYKNAIKYADVVAKEIYEKEANTIFMIQKRILEISQKEDPFDIFICYKDTDEFRNRTEDSVIAQDIYDELVKKGYRVFFSRITLESKLGTEYEPYIFAALNTAKVMVFVTANVEYINAPWVKNEWSRYLDIINQSPSKKYLIPCFKNMDAYDLPEEMAGLQSQDLSKIGWMQDLLHGIDKLIDKKKVEIKESKSFIDNSVSIDNLFTRIDIALEDEDYEKVDELLEKILDHDPKNAKAYVYKLLMDFELQNVFDLKNLSQPFDDNPNYQKALRFASKEYKAEIKGYNDSIKERIKLAEKERIYQQARNSNLDTSIYLLEQLGNYKDSQELLIKAKETKIYNEKNDIYMAANHNYDIFKQYKNERYMEESISLLSKIKGFKDSDELLKSRKEEYIAYKKYLEELAIENEKRRILRNQRIKKFFKIFTPIFAFLTLCYCLITFVIIPNAQYNKAMEYIENGNYDAAEDILNELGDSNFSDANNQIIILKAHDDFLLNKYETGITKLYNIGTKITVKFDANGGTTENETIILKDTNSYKENIASKDGYEFVGWDLKEYSINNNKNDYSSLVTLSAKYQLVDYDLSFDLKDGTVGTKILPSSYNLNSNLSIPNPTKLGYTFIGWTCEGVSTPVKDMIIANQWGTKHYTANYVPNNYVVYYNLNYDDLDLVQQTIAYESKINLLSFEREGYEFIEWRYNGIKFDWTNYNYIGNITLTAVWEAILYTITYNLDGGINHQNNPHSFKVTDDTITLKNPTKIGYAFLGWTGNGTTVPTKNLVLSKATLNDKSFEAHWEANTYTISFNVNDGDNDINNEEYTYDEYVTLPTVTRVGYTFAGWYNGTTRVNNGYWKIDAALTLKAEWVANDDVVYTVNHYKQDIGGTAYSLSKVDTFEGTSDTQVTPATYNFEGFTSPSTSELTVYPDGTAILDYYYTRNIYKVEFVTNGGLAMDEISLYYEEELDSTIISTRSNYTFGGWYIDAMQSNKFDGIMTSNDMILYAWWCEETKAHNFEFSIMFNTDSVGSRDYYAQIVKYTGHDSNVTIPKYYKNHPIKSVFGTAFKGNLTLERVNFPDGITTISANTFADIETLKYVRLPNDVKEIGEKAFYNTKNLKEIELPETLRKIHSYAFSYSGLVSIEIPEKISSIFEFAFEKTKIKELYLPDGILNLGQGMVSGCDELEKIDIPYITNLDYLPFGYIFSKKEQSNMYNADSYYFPYTLKEITVRGKNIGDEAFKGIKTVETITLGNDITFMGDKIFENCESLKIINMPSLETKKMLDYFGNTVFEGSYKIVYDAYTDYYIPESLTTINLTTDKNVNIPDAAFKGFKSLTNIILPEKLETIGLYAFSNCSNITNLTLPHSVTFIMNGAFVGMTKLESITLPLFEPEYDPFGNYKSNISAYFDSTIPESLKTITVTEETIAIPSYAFYGLSSIENIILNDNIEAIGEYSFFRTGISHINLNDKITSIPNYAFYYNENLVEFKFPNNLITIGNYALAGNSKLTNLSIPETIVSIGKNAFEGLNQITTLTLPSSISNIGEDAFKEMKLSYLQMPFKTGHPMSYYSVDSSTLNEIVINGGTIVPENAFYSFKTKKITLPDTITLIGNNAFSGMTNLTDLVIGNNIETIGEQAFYNTTSLNELNSPTELKSIGEYAFLNSGIKKFTLNNNVNNVGYGIFKGTNMDEVVWNAKNPNITSYSNKGTIIFEDASVKELIFGEDVQVIPEKILDSISVNKVIIGKSVIKINDRAFYNSYNTEFDFVNASNIIEIGNYAFYSNKNIADLSIFSSIKTIGAYAFAKCEKLLNIVLSDTLENIGLKALDEVPYVYLDTPFIGKNLTDPYNPEDSTPATVLNYIGIGNSDTLEIKIRNKDGLRNYALSGISKVTKVHLPENMEYLYPYSLKGTNITEIDLPNTLKWIGNSSLSYTKISSISLPDSLETIHNLAFQGLSFEELVIPNSVQTLTEYSLYGVTMKKLTLPFVGESRNSETNYKFEYVFANPNCNSVNQCDLSIKHVIPSELKEVTITSGVIKPGALSNIREYISTINLGSEVTDFSVFAFATSSDSNYWEVDTVNAINVSQDNNIYSSIDGTLYNKEKTKIIKYLRANQSDSFVVPAGVIEIGDYAFYGNRHLKTINLNDVTVIGKYSFAWSAISNVIGGEKLEKIDNYAFNSLYSNGNVTILLGDKLKYIGDHAFDSINGAYPIRPLHDQKLFLSSSIEYIGYMAISPGYVYCEPETMPEGWNEEGIFSYYSSQSIGNKSGNNPIIEWGISYEEYLSILSQNS